MLCRRIFERINFENSRESLLSKTFKITDIAGQEAIFLKDDEGRSLFWRQQKTES
jgi:hypothetical protein